MTTTNWEKFCLLMWKNWLLQIRHKVQTLTEILVPVGFCCLLVTMRILVKTTVFENDFIFDEMQMNNLTIDVR
jgi:ATP-binding cassette, subfamily A (ABC1), member 3